MPEEKKYSEADLLKAKKEGLSLGFRVADRHHVLRGPCQHNRECYMNLKRLIDEAKNLPPELTNHPEIEFTQFQIYLDKLEQKYEELS
mgnify:CR=1 FL=1